MSLLQQRDVTLNKARRYPRVRIPTPFTCSLSSLGTKRWFRRPHIETGVVYDLSLRGVRVSTEASIKPGDQVSLTLRLPQDILPAEIAVATVRWTKDQVYGLAFRRLSRSSFEQLIGYMDAAGIAKG